MNAPRSTSSTVGTGSEPTPVCARSAAAASSARLWRATLNARRVSGTWRHVSAITERDRHRDQRGRRPGHQEQRERERLRDRQLPVVVAPRHPDRDHLAEDDQRREHHELPEMAPEQVVEVVARPRARARRDRATQTAATYAASHTDRLLPGLPMPVSYRAVRDLVEQLLSMTRPAFDPTAVGAGPQRRAVCSLSPAPGPARDWGKTNARRRLRRERARLYETGQISRRRFLDPPRRRRRDRHRRVRTLMNATGPAAFARTVAGHRRAATARPPRRYGNRLATTATARSVRRAPGPVRLRRPGQYGQPPKHYGQPAAALREAARSLRQRRPVTTASRRATGGNKWRRAGGRRR